MEVGVAVTTALVAVVMCACVLCCAGQCKRVKVERRRSMQEVGGGAVMATALVIIVIAMRAYRGGRHERVEAERWRLMREGGSGLERRWSLHLSPSSPSSCGCTDMVN